MSEIPASLLEMQTWFSGIITRPFREQDSLHIPVYDAETIREIEQRIPPTATLRSDQRLGLYHQQYWWRLFFLLQEYYPTLQRMFGYVDFNEKLAEPYFLHTPPAHWFLPNVSFHFLPWLKDHYWEEDRALVLQAAILDEVYERLYYAPMLPPLSQIDPGTPIYMQPTAELFELNADFFAFRSRFLEEELPYWEENPFPDLDVSKPKYYFLLYLQSDGMRHYELEKAQFLLLSAFQSGATLEDACDKLEDQGISDEVALSISDWFKKWCEIGLLTASSL